MKKATVKEELNRIAEEICDSYCKWPEHCLSKEKDPDKAEEMLYSVYCEKCPLMEL